MKFLHTADWHLGYRQYGMAVRESDFIKPLDEIADIAVNEKVDAVLVAGDIFDNFRPPAYAVQAARAFGERMNTYNIPVLTIDGNHDPSNGTWADLCNFNPLDHVAANAHKLIECGGVVFSGVSFCRTQQLLERLKTMQMQGVDLRGGVLALHMEIAELTAYSTALSLRELEPYMDALNVGYVALGHIHNPVSTCNDAGRIYRYPGSTEMNDISELGPKYVDIVTCENGKYSYESLSLRTRQFAVIDIDTAEAIDEKLVPLLKDPETFWLVKVNLSAPGKPIERVEEVLKDRLYRILPYGNRTIEENTDKHTVVIGLKDAIDKFFALDSDEAALVSRMIDTPEQTKAIADEYINNKKEENNGTH